VIASITLWVPVTRPSQSRVARTNNASVALGSILSPTTTSEKEILKMETHSNNRLSTLFELDRQTAVRALKDIAPDAEKTKGRPTWKISTFAKALEAHHLRNSSNANDGATGSDGNSETSSLISARIRVANANAESKERANAAARGELCHIDSAVAPFAAAMGVMRETMLTMPGKLADELAAYSEKDRIAIFEIIHREVFATLTALSSPETYAEAGVAFVRSSPSAQADLVAADKKTGDLDDE
jgi:hypothetical protein